MVEYSYQISLINVVMELRKLCCHPYMLEGVEPDIEDTKESFKLVKLSPTNIAIYIVNLGGMNFLRIDLFNLFRFFILYSQGSDKCI